MNVSVTDAQVSAIDDLQATHKLPSRAAVVKLALAELIDRSAS